MGNIIPERFRQWQKAEANAEQTKGAGAFEEFLRLDSKGLAKGKYRIQWYAEAALNAGNTSQPKMRVQLDGVQIGIHVWQPTTEFDGHSGWDIGAFNAGDTPSITIEVRRLTNGGSDVCKFKRLKLSIEPMESNPRPRGSGGGQPEIPED